MLLLAPFGRSAANIVHQKIIHIEHKTLKYIVY